MGVLLHVFAGGLALVSGFIALFALKGGTLHRQSGLVFVCSMVVMGLTGAALAALNAAPGNVIAGLLATYLVVTALTAVRPSTATTRGLEAGALAWAMVVGLGAVAVAIRSLTSGDVTTEAGRAPVFFVFGAVALLASAGDARMLRAGGLQGPPRLKRHLWRMCFALWVASASFFLGQANVVPEPLRTPILLAVPVLTPLLAMAYWFWRLRNRRRAHPHARPRAGLKLSEDIVYTEVAGPGTAELSGLAHPPSKQ
jgi:uncharacterized membrane protein